MCGIIGYIGSRDALSVIMEGLSKLEYRGYDSSGVAIFEDGKVQITRAVGKLSELRNALKYRPENKVANLGIGHTRWATHGRPSETNAHPHSAGRVSLIHNGIIENYIELREELKKSGSVFKSETDTEIAAHVLNRHLEEGLAPYEALKATCREVKGSYAFLAMDSQNPDRILVAKSASPIILGIGDGETFVASDIPAVLPYTRKVLILEDGDIVEVTSSTITIENNGVPVTRTVQNITWDPVTAQKGGFKHYMLKEISEQSTVLTETFRGRIQVDDPKIILPELGLSERDIKAINRIVLVGCGTAWHAGLVAKFYFESLARIPCEVDYASEFRYREPVVDNNTLVLAVSQSGETADTLGAIDAAGNARTMAVCNVVGSSMTRKAKDVVFTHAGPEISVASTKAFTTQLVTLYLLAVHFGQVRGTLDKGRVASCNNDLLHLPAAIEQACHLTQEVEAVAKKFQHAKDFLFLGRGICYPIALEGALKLKEISYIHAEGYPAGEMKHGPIALINEEMPLVVVLHKSDLLYDKTVSNLREVESRGGRIIVVTDTDTHTDVANFAEAVIKVPYVSELLSPVILTVPLQLLAYYVAVLNGTDVDLPRNLAKSVTVE